jgi:glycosyltransferase involved in cell wall biosynthesis
VALSTAAVIPARDEAATLAETLDALRNVVDLSHILVVDDGSQDATAEIARGSGAEVLYTSSPGKGRGKGHALRLGLIHARERSPDVLLLADADLGYSAARLARLLDAMDEHHPAVVAAFPPAAARGGFGLVKDVSRRAILRRTGYAPSEPLSGQRALLVSVLDVLPGIAPGFGAEVGMTLDLLSAGIKPLEISLPLTHRPTGRKLSGFVHRARQGLDVARALRGARIPW